MECLDSVQIQECGVQVENLYLHLFISVFRKGEAKNTIIDMPHDHDSTEVFICQSGKVIIKTTGGHITLSDGDAVIIPPGITHVKHPTSEDTVSYVLSFNCTRKSRAKCDDVYDLLLPFINGDKICVFRGQKAFTDCANAIYSNLDSGTVLPALSMVDLLVRATQMPFERGDSDCHDPMLSNKAMDRGYQLDHLIAYYYNKKVSAAQFAQHLHICPRQLDRIMLKRYGKSLHAVIMEKRIKTAEQLLLTTDKTNEQIATELGFSSASGFYREFFRQHRLTPNEFRKNSPDNDD